MTTNLEKIWAKTDKGNSSRWHPLLLHMLDVAACADAILAHEPESTRNRISSIIGMQWIDARPWLLFAIACHDLGKASPGFQCKWKNLTALLLPRKPNTSINHAFVSQIVLAALLREMGWPDKLAELTADAVGCHHGERSSPSSLFNLEGDRSALGGDDWRQARQDIVEILLNVFKPVKIPTRPEWLV